MWTYLGKRVREGRVFTDNTGRKYPPQWMYRTTDAEKTALGMVWVDDPAPFDNRFYWGRDAEGSLIPKAIDDIDAVDEEGNPVLDEKGEQVITRGLKWNAVQLVKQQAAGRLQPTDWYVVRKSETGAEIPADVLTYRGAVRTASNAIEAAITACTTHEAFMALYETPVDDEGNPTGNAPINDWPEE